MLEEQSLYDMPPKVKTNRVSDRFVVNTLHHDHIVIDRTTGLMWQQATSSQRMDYSLAMKRIDYLNKRGFAGFNDWRLPTLEEATTLIEQSPNNDGLYIDPIFIPKQRMWLWTSDRGNADLAWYVNFNYGYSQLNRIKSGHNYVCAVR